MFDSRALQNAVQGSDEVQMPAILSLLTQGKDLLVALQR
jgi:hypothetical protein